MAQLISITCIYDPRLLESLHLQRRNSKQGAISMQNVFLSMSPTAQVLAAVSILWLAGFIASRATKVLHLPNVTGYILAGVVVGPFALNLVPQNLVDGMGFLTDVALSFIAFGVGRYLRLDRLRQQGPRVIVLTLMEALVTAAVVAVFMITVFHLSVPFSLLLGAIGSATAPASSLMTIRQYRAKGPFVNTLVQVVAMDDAVAHARSRKAFGVQVGRFQQIETLLTDMEVRLRNMRSMVYRAAWSIDAADETERLDVALMKRYVPEASVQVASDAMQILGGPGYTEGSRVSRIWEDCRGNQIAEGTDQVMVYIAAPLIIEHYRSF